MEVVWQLFFPQLQVNWKLWYPFYHTFNYWGSFVINGPIVSMFVFLCVVACFVSCIFYLKHEQKPNNP